MEIESIAAGKKEREVHASETRETHVETKESKGDKEMETSSIAMGREEREVCTREGRRKCLREREGRVCTCPLERIKWREEVREREREGGSKESERSGG